VYSRKAKNNKMPPLGLSSLLTPDGICHKPDHTGHHDLADSSPPLSASITHPHDPLSLAEIPPLTLTPTIGPKFQSSRLTSFNQFLTNAADNSAGGNRGNRGSINNGSSRCRGGSLSLRSGEMQNGILADIQNGSQHRTSFKDKGFRVKNRTSFEGEEKKEAGTEKEEPAKKEPAKEFSTDEEQKRETKLNEVKAKEMVREKIF
jgi:hypothetical protein